ncbi:hypothetical protein PROFUN_03310 [Planoprotostelium fungivorum]|uniref:Uncharacterized protein n=1 Tax=Planoprotostelium fungivorum TaxID=1890364 RepID=A0A2P6NWU1_9EUKA|nr:hypothetical protein PROFUN_03310 [Planoprotostelium fungivorum]
MSDTSGQSTEDLTQKLKSHIIEHHQLSINRDQYKSLSSLYDSKEIIHALSQLVKDKSISFPFKSYGTEGVIHIAMFPHLSNIEKVNNYEVPRDQYRELTLYNNVDLVHRTREGPDGNDYNDIDYLSDFFQEEQRLKGRRSDCRESPLEFWENDSHKVFEEIISNMQRNDKVQLDSHNIRETLWKMTKECTIFKPSLVACIYRHFGAKRVLDISAGWGDRLLGAINCDLQLYLAADPNKSLSPGYDAVKNRFCDEKTRGNFIILPRPFQSITDGEFDEISGGEKFDLVFTSPPFFDFEIYTNDEGQSVIEHPKLNDWIVHFLFVCLSNAWRQLKPGGHMCIHLSDVFKTKICAVMNYFVLSLEGAISRESHRKIIGCIGGQSKVFPAWVWKKREENEEEDVKGRQLARDSIFYNYPASTRAQGRDTGVQTETETKGGAGESTETKEEKTEAGDKVEMKEMDDKVETRETGDNIEERREETEEMDTGDDPKMKRR